MNEDAKFDDEVERRLTLLETPGSGESYLPDVPGKDIAIAIVVLTVLTIILLIWAY